MPIFSKSSKDLILTRGVFLFLLLYLFFIYQSTASFPLPLSQKVLLPLTPGHLYLATTTRALKQHHLPQARRALEKAQEHLRSPYLLTLLQALLFQEEKKPTQAFQLFYRAYQEHPENTAIIPYLFLLAGQAGKSQRQWIDQAAAQSKGDFNALCAIGTAYTHYGDWDKAYPYLRNCLLKATDPKAKEKAQRAWKQVQKELF